MRNIESRCKMSERLQITTKVIFVIQFHNNYIYQDLIVWIEKEVPMIEHEPIINQIPCENVPENARTSNQQRKRSVGKSRQKRSIHR